MENESQNKVRKYKNPIQEKEKRNRDDLLGRSGSSTLKRKIHLQAWDYLGRVCADCGYAKNNPSYYDFHHRDKSTKKFQVTQKMTKFSFERIKDELDKCVLLCVICHRKRHSLDERKYSSGENTVRVRSQSWANKRRAFEAKGSRCSICGFNEDNLSCYDYHHDDEGSKRLTLVQSWGQSKYESLVKELNKCSLLCANCHRELHMDRCEAAHKEKLKKLGRYYIVIGDRTFVCHGKDISVKRGLDGMMDVAIRGAVVREYTDGKRVEDK